MSKSNTNFCHCIVQKEKPHLKLYNNNKIRFECIRCANCKKQIGIYIYTLSDILKEHGMW